MENKAKELCRARNDTGEVRAIIYKDENGKLIIYGDRKAAEKELAKHGYSLTDSTLSPSRVMDSNVNDVGKSGDLPISTESPTDQRKKT